MIGWLGLSVLLALAVHEFGHYVCAFIFGWNPRFRIRRKGFCVTYSAHVKGNEAKMVVTSFFGIIGLIPILLYCMLSMSLLNHLFLVALFGFYSLFETICRWRMVKKDAEL